MDSFSQKRLHHVCLTLCTEYGELVLIRIQDWKSPEVGVTNRPGIDLWISLGQVLAF